MTIHQPVLRLTDVGLGFTSVNWTRRGRRRTAKAIAAGVNLTVHSGEIVGVVGKSGCGKSTLLEVAGSLRAPLCGSVFWGDSNLTAQSKRRVTAMRAGYVRFVTQGDSLVSWLSPVDNLLLQAEAQHLPLTRAQAYALLERVDPGERVLAAPSSRHLSGGERHRVILARALVGQPRLILADEPTGSLDGEARQTVQQLLFRLARETGAALVVVTHDPDLATLLPTVYELSGGQLAQRVAA